MEIIRNALGKIKNVNNGVTLDMLFDAINQDDTNPILTRDQIKRAMRVVENDSNVQSISTGVWRIKGRYVGNVSGVADIYPRYVSVDYGLNKREMKKLQIRQKRAMNAFYI